MKERLTNKQKAAALLIALGPEKSSGIFQHLKELEIEDLVLEIASMKTVSTKEKESVLSEFYEMCLGQEYLVEGGFDYAKDLLQKALGKEKADQVLGKLTNSLQVRPFDFVRKADPSQILGFIQNEHPQTIALVLSYLNPIQAGTILSSLEGDKQADIAQRIAQMDRFTPEVVSQIEKELEKKLSSLVSQDFANVGGIDSIVEIISSVDRSTEKNILEKLEEQDTELAEAIKKQMFVFEDITGLDGRSIQKVLNEVPQDRLVIALKGTSDTVKQIIFTNVSKRKAQTIKEELDYLGPTRLKDIEEAQQEIVNIIRSLEEKGDIIISRGAGDDVVV